MKPHDFIQPFVVMQRTAYQIVEANGSTAPMNGGVLNVGRVVYLPKPNEVQDLGQARVLAYAEGIGRLSVSRHVLVHA